ncbi:MAG: DUF4197 domain-containing protein [Gammaproteobacteria bacterium]
MLCKSLLQSSFLLVVITLTSSCADLDKLVKRIDNNSGLSNSQIAAGLKEALRVGSTTVVGNLGRQNGFNKDRIAHINLPKNLGKVQSALGKIGYGHYLDDLELKLNRAAEKATPRAKALFYSAIKQLTWQDVKTIYNGPDDAATRYFQKKMTPPLRQDMFPVINSVLAEVGAIQSYERAISKYETIPFMPDVRADLTNYTIDKTLDAIFYYLAKEEAAIRKDPTKRTTELLRQVFG